MMPTPSLRVTNLSFGFLTHSDERVDVKIVSHEHPHYDVVKVKEEGTEKSYLVTTSNLIGKPKRF